MRLALLPLLLLACHPARAPIMGPTNSHVCRSYSGQHWPCFEFESCGPSFGMCEWLGDQEGPGWGDIQQEGGYREVPDR